MPTPTNHKSGHIETHRKGGIAQKSSSFHGYTAASVSPATMSATQVRRPKTLPNLVPDRRHDGTVPEVLPRQPPKLLLKVTMLGSLGPVQVLMKPDSMVGDLVAAAVRQYMKEGRRPMLPSNNPSDFDLHYSQFSLENLNREEKLMDLGSRNFFLCLRKPTTTVDGCAGRDGNVTTLCASCCKEAGKVSKGGGFAWLRFMDFLL